MMCFDGRIYYDNRMTNDEIYQLYCENLVRSWFVDNLLRSVEYQRLAWLHRIDYIVWRLGL